MIEGDKVKVPMYGTVTFIRLERSDTDRPVAVLQVEPGNVVYMALEHVESLE